MAIQLEVLILSEMCFIAGLLVATSLFIYFKK